MVKEAIKNFYGLVDAKDAEGLNVALQALNATESKEQTTVEDVVTETEVQLGVATLEDGETLIYFPGDVLSQGSPIFADEDLVTPVGAGEWTLENGDVITTNDDGIVESIVPAEGEAEEEEPAEETEEEAEAATVNVATEATTPSSVKETNTREISFSKEEMTAMIEGAVTASLEPLKERITTLESTNVELSKDKEELEGKVKKLSKASAAAPYTEGPTHKGKSVSLSTGRGTAYSKAKNSGLYTERK